MRTTLTIDDDVLLAAKVLAETQDVSVGIALSQLARRGLNTTTDLPERNGIPLFPVSENAQVITLEQVKRLEDEP